MVVMRQTNRVSPQVWLFGGLFSFPPNNQYKSIYFFNQRIYLESYKMCSSAFLDRFEQLERVSLKFRSKHRKKNLDFCKRSHIILR